MYVIFLGGSCDVKKQAVCIRSLEEQCGLCTCMKRSQMNEEEWPEAEREPGQCRVLETRLWGQREIPKNWTLLKGSEESRIRIFV